MKQNHVIGITLMCLSSAAAAQVVGSSQASVQLYGTVDVGGRYVKADGQARRLSEITDGLNSSQLDFKGYEDLGGGLGAGFTLLASLAADTGTTNTKFFNRRSTLSLFSPYGELRLGRDYVPTFWPLNQADPFGLVGISAGGAHQLYEGTRQDNSVGYFLPSNLGGIYGQAMVSAAEGGTSGDKPTRYTGARVGWTSGPFDISVAGAARRFAAQSSVGSVGLTGSNVAVVAQPGDYQHTYAFATSWDFGPVKVAGMAERESLRTFQETLGEIGLWVRLGVGEIHASYERSTLKNSASGGISTKVDQFALGGVYNLSKRTALYATAARLRNKDNTALTLPTASGQTARGGKSQGAEVGLRHFF